MATQTVLRFMTTLDIDPDVTFLVPLRGDCSTRTLSDLISAFRVRLLKKLPGYSNYTVRALTIAGGDQLDPEANGDDTLDSLFPTFTLTHPIIVHMLAPAKHALKPSPLGVEATQQGGDTIFSVVKTPSAADGDVPPNVASPSSASGPSPMNGGTDVLPKLRTTRRLPSLTSSPTTTPMKAGATISPSTSKPSTPHAFHQQVEPRPPTRPAMGPRTRHATVPQQQQQQPMASAMLSTSTESIGDIPPPPPAPNVTPDRPPRPRTSVPKPQTNTSNGMSPSVLARPPSASTTPTQQQRPHHLPLSPQVAKNGGTSPSSVPPPPPPAMGPNAGTPSRRVPSPPAIHRPVISSAPPTRSALRALQEQQKQLESEQAKFESHKQGVATVVRGELESRAVLVREENLMRASMAAVCETEHTVVEERVAARTLHEHLAHPLLFAERARLEEDWRGAAEEVQEDERLELLQLCNIRDALRVYAEGVDGVVRVEASTRHTIALDEDAAFCLISSKYERSVEAILHEERLAATQVEEAHREGVEREHRKGLDRLAAPMLRLIAHDQEQHELVFEIEMRERFSKIVAVEAVAWEELTNDAIDGRTRIQLREEEALEREHKGLMDEEGLERGGIELTYDRKVKMYLRSFVEGKQRLQQK
eukprot:PhM_4_TR10364/c0_g1_i1/m.27423